MLRILLAEASYPTEGPHSPRIPGRGGVVEATRPAPLRLSVLMGRPAGLTSLGWNGMNGLNDIISQKALQRAPGTRKALRNVSCAALFIHGLFSTLLIIIIVVNDNNYTNKELNKQRYVPGTMPNTLGIISNLTLMTTM